MELYLVGGIEKSANMGEIFLEMIFN